MNVGIDNLYHVMIEYLFQLGKGMGVVINMFRISPSAEGIPSFYLKGHVMIKGKGGTPGRIRTCDLRIRSPLLYPAELQAHKGWFKNTTGA
jgi:hypothetical protein